MDIAKRIDEMMVEDTKLSGNIKWIASRIDNAVMIAITNTLNSEIDKINKAKKWEYDGQQNEVLLYIAENRIEYFRNLKKMAERDMKK